MTGEAMVGRALGWLVAAALAVACGGNTTGGTAQDVGAGTGGGATGGSSGLGGSTGGVGALGGTGGMGGAEQQPTAHPPPDPGGPPAEGTVVVALAVQKLFLGDTDRQLVQGNYAWKSFGYDLDGLFSSKSSTAHCAPAEGANPASVKGDGNGGIDNSFGQNVLPVVKSFVSFPSQEASEDIADGRGTYLFRFLDLGTQQNQSPVSTGFLGGAPHPTTPTWDGNDVWPITAESVDGTPSQPKVSLTGYVASGTWVAHATAPITVNITTPDVTWPLVIHGAIISAEVSGSGAGLVGKNGTIVGVLDTEEFISGFLKIAGLLDPNVCDSSVQDSIAQQIRAANDIMKDGSNGDPSKKCDGISIGLGFEAIAAGIGAVAPPALPPPVPCVN